MDGDHLPFESGANSGASISSHKQAVLVSEILKVLQVPAVSQSKRNKIAQLLQANQDRHISESARLNAHVM